jgi:hypothetical protein
LEISGLKVAWEQVRNAVVVLYSGVVMATLIPGVSLVPNLAVLFYYFLIPGYFVTLLLRETSTILERLFYSIVWSLAIFASVYSIRSLGYQALPTNLTIPALTVVLLAYDHFHRQ